MSPVIAGAVVPLAKALPASGDEALEAIARVSVLKPSIESFLDRRRLGATALVAWPEAARTAERSW